jgi:hypothetical protein
MVILVTQKGGNFVRNGRIYLAALLAFPAMLESGAPIGVVTSDGDFLLNDARVSGNATLTDGALVQTAEAPSILRLSHGARLELGRGARAKVFADRLVLEAGYSDIRATAKYAIEAASLRIMPASADTAGRVVRQGERVVQVGVAEGSVRVFNAGGVLLANVFPGSPLEFEPQVVSAAPPSSFAGCLLRKQDKWILYDQTTRIIVELRGTGFDKEWGNRVQVIGTTDTSAQSEVGAQVVDVSSLTRLAQGGCEGVAGLIGASLPKTPLPAGPAPTTGGGMSAGTKVAIVAAVGGGAGAGAYFATRKSRSP